MNEKIIVIGFTSSDMLDENLHTNNCDFKAALVLAINVKNSVSSIHEFSPLLISTSSKSQSTLSKTPTITSSPTNKSHRQKRKSY